MKTMTNLMKIEQNLTMTSREIAELTGKRHDHVIRDVREMLAELEDAPVLGDVKEDKDSRGYTACFHLNKDLTLTLVAGYNTKMRLTIIQRWQELEAQVKKPMSQIEVLLASVQMLADVEKRQQVMQVTLTEHSEKVAVIEEDVEELKDTNLLKACPSNAETITDIRKRMNQQYGLSANIVNKVMSDIPYSPRAYGYVLNKHPDASGSTYSVYLKRDVSDVFKRFVKECQLVTVGRYEHPFIEGKFKLSK